MRKVCEEFPNYEVSDDGCVYSLKTGKLLIGQINQGRHFVHVQKDKKGHTVSVHRLTAKAFIENPYNKPEVNHIDGNPLNNNVENLEWVTASENMFHDYRVLGRKAAARKLTENQVECIRSLLKFNPHQGVLAKLFKVHQSTISNIKNEKYWRL